MQCFVGNVEEEMKGIMKIRYFHPFISDMINMINMSTYIRFQQVRLTAHDQTM